MATKALITAEQYLGMTFEHDAEFVHGEIVERAMPDNLHSKIQLLILLAIGSLMQTHRLHPRPELRLKLSADLFRIPDICVFAGTEPLEAVPSTPPLLVIEILSKDDRYLEVMQKLEEYRLWGVPHIWTIDPMNRRLSTYSELGLHNASSLALPGYPLELTPSDLF